VDWHRHLLSGLPSETEVRLLLASERANAAVDDTPHYLDSGAMSHCSPHRADFLELMLIAPCRIKGVDGSYIAAVRIGRVKIWCGKGRQLELRDILYVPQVALCLISVGKTVLRTEPGAVRSDRGWTGTWAGDGLGFSRVDRCTDSAFTSCISVT